MDSLSYKQICRNEDCTMNRVCTEGKLLMRLRTDLSRYVAGTGTKVSCREWNVEGPWRSDAEFATSSVRSIWGDFGPEIMQIFRVVQNDKTSAEQFEKQLLERLGDFPRVS